MTAQNDSNHLPISIGLWANYFTQPGIKLETQVPIKNLASNSKIKQLYWAPQLGFFTYPQNHNGLLLGVDLGIKKRKEGRKMYSSYALGIAYLGQSRLNSFSVNLGDGSSGSSQRVWQSFFLGTLNYTLGRTATKGPGWYTKLSAGPKLQPGGESSFIAGMELGLTFNLNKK